MFDHQLDGQTLCLKSNRSYLNKERRDYRSTRMGERTIFVDEFQDVASKDGN
jgi:hypothetical protein